MAIRAVAVVMASILGVVAVDARAAAQWAVDPSVPGPNRPVAGTSLFDELTADGIPFPFEALVRKIERAADCPPGRCTTSVLIPLGRSLQRSAASPDFFRYPRVVTALTADGVAPLHLKDRVYLGYQERADVLEVISYNEAAGRFEFQLVRDYRADGARQVVAADRAVCASCHQNQAPIFSRQQWDETNANPRIAEAIESHQPHPIPALYGVTVRRGVDLPNAIDDATERSNLIAVVQRLWRDACDRQCRAAAVAAALQYRLSQQQGFATRTRIAAGFSKAWPDGLAIPNADIPNRDPLALAVDRTPAGEVDVPAAFDALAPRAPSEIWKADDAALESRFVAGLASMIADSDLAAIETTLLRGAPPRTTLRADCIENGEQFRCDGEFAMTATPTRVERLRIRGGELTDLTLRAGGVSRRGGHARTTAGDRIERIDLQRGARGARATLTLVEDFSVQRPSIDRTDWGAVFTRTPLRATFGLTPVRACCGNPRQAALEDVAIAASPAAAPFTAACGSCHRTVERSPPNFLTGDNARVDAALKHCAPRMFVRLAMWQMPSSTRAKVPMPPPRAAQDGTPHVQAKADAAVASLQSAVAEWLRRESGSEPSVEALLARGYENLRPCLPPGS